MEKLSEKEITDKLNRISKNWELKDNFLTCEFRFKNFNQAFSFITAVALESEKANHHPNWENAFTYVKISLTTHSIQALSTMDFNLASKIDEISLIYT